MGRFHMHVYPRTFILSADQKTKPTNERRTFSGRRTSSPSTKMRRQGCGVLRTGIQLASSRSVSERSHFIRSVPSDLHCQLWTLLRSTLKTSIKWKKGPNLFSRTWTVSVWPVWSLYQEKFAKMTSIS